MPKSRFQSIVFALLMVVFMVVAMEFYNQALLDGRLSWIAMSRSGFADFIPAWLTTIGKNLPMAFFWQVLFCGPLVRFLFSRIFRSAAS